MFINERKYDENEKKKMTNENLKQTRMCYVQSNSDNINA